MIGEKIGLHVRSTLTRLARAATTNKPRGGLFRLIETASAGFDRFLFVIMHRMSELAEFVYEL